MRVLIMTKIFPNRVEPLSSPFNRRQFAALGKLCDVEVLATIPWFPGATAFRRWSSAGRLAKVPRKDTIEGLSVRHPRTLLLPKIGHSVAGHLYAASLALSALEHRGRVDVVLAVSREEVIDDQVVDDVNAEAQLPEEYLETSSEPEYEIRVRSPVPGHGSCADENVRPNGTPLV